jgi:hypothetical protein
MANTFVQIGSTVTVGAGGAASMDFTSIPSTYTDLLVLVSSRNSGANNNDDLLMRFNGSSTSYSNKSIYGTGTGAASNSPFTTYIYGGSNNGNTSTASTFSSNLLYIPNYAGSTNKSVSVEGVQENNSAQAFMNIIAGLWSNTAAITSISLSSGANFVQYSTATLYGIKNS